MARKLTKAERIARIPDIEISRLKGPEGKKKLESYVRTLQSSYRRRVGQFKRQGEFSYAQYALEKSFTPGARGKISNMSMRQLHMEFARYSSFFKSETSTLQGIRKVNREQDVRIFGIDETTGRPLNTMSSSQREAYWDLYEDYMRVHPESHPSSEYVQQIIGSAKFIPRDTEDDFNIPERIEKIHGELEAIRDYYAMGSAPNVYMGGGPFITG